jgi:hypothetical protein
MDRACCSNGLSPVEQDARPMASMAVVMNVNGFIFMLNYLFDFGGTGSYPKVPSG